ncbi:MAG: type VI secretion system-associated protein TagF [Paracoccaceae bacterium]
MIGILGKHPGFGDFISHGLGAANTAWFERWLGAVLPKVRSDLDSRWEAVYDNAADLRFWIGAQLIEGASGPAYGVLRASRDRVGRRYPLIAAAIGSSLYPPALETEQAPYEALSGAFDALSEAPESAQAIADKITEAAGDLAPCEPLGIGAPLFAANPDPDPAGLWAVASTIDHLRAASARAYFWTKGDGARAATVYSAAVMPDAAVLAWLWEGSALEAAVEEESGADPQYEVGYE